MFFSLDTNKELSVSQQHFSGQDKSKTGDIGVVFPLACDDSVNMLLNVSSILDHHNQGIRCKHTEARYATANTQKKEIEYSETKCVAIEYNNESNELASLLDIVSGSVYESSVTITSKLKDKINEYLKVLETAQQSFFIDSNLISKREYRSSTLYRGFQSDTLWEFEPSIKSNSQVSPLIQEQESFIENFGYTYENYLVSLSNQGKDALRSVTDYFLSNYYGSYKPKQLLSKKALGEDTFKLKSVDKAKEWFKDETFSNELIEHLLGIVQVYDLDLIKTR